MKIRELLTDESKWIKGFLASNKSKELSIDPNSSDAACWCLIGAVDRCYPFGSRDRFAVLEKLLCEISARNYLSISSFNDYTDTTFEDVKQLVETLDV